MRSSPAPAAARLGWIVLVLAANAIWLARISSWMDVPVSMDAYYVEVARGGWPAIHALPAAWGPLYAAWLTIPLSLWPDPIDLYLGNAALLSLAVSLALFAMNVALTRRYSLAALASVAFVSSGLNLPLSPKVALFAAAILCLAVAAATRTSSIPASLAIAGAGAAFASVARPEFSLAAALFLGLALVLVVTSKKGQAAVALAFVVAALAVAVFGNPVAPGSGDARLFDAVREHFGRNWEAWQGHPVTLPQAWSAAFGDAKDLTSAWRFAPSHFLHHWSTNFWRSGGWLLSEVPPAPFAGLVLVVLGVRGPWNLRQWKRSGSQASPPALLAMGILGFAGLSSAVFVFPEPHYLVVPALLCLSMASLLLSSLPVSLPGWSRGLAVASFVAYCFAASPPGWLDPSPRRPVVDTVRFVRAQPIARPATVLTVGDGIGTWLGDGFHEVKAWQRGTRSIREYMDEHGVDLVVTFEAGRESFAIDDDGWRVLHIAPEQIGFRRMAVPNHPQAKVFVRESALDGRPSEESVP